MKNIINLFLIIVCFFATSCQGTKDALQGKSRGERSDEFLVQKKNPLSMPPDFNELPVPLDENIIETKESESGLKDKLKVSTKVKKPKNSKSKSLEQTIIEKTGINLELEIKIIGE